MRDDRDYKLDISSIPAPEPTPARPTRPFVHVQFDCCNTYLRIYRDPTATEYKGRCPKCQRPVVLKVGAGGTSERFFRVS